MEEAADQRRLPWRRTVAVQVALCLALYAAFSLGEPQLRQRGGGAEAALGRAGRGPGGVSFLSVAGGARPPAEQARLLRQLRTFIHSGNSGSADVSASPSYLGSFRAPVYWNLAK